MRWRKGGLLLLLLVALLLVCASVLGEENEPVGDLEVDIETLTEAPVQLLNVNEEENPWAMKIETSSPHWRLAPSVASPLTAHVVELELRGTVAPASMSSPLARLSALTVDNAVTAMRQLQRVRPSIVCYNNLAWRIGKVEKQCEYQILAQELQVAGLTHLVVVHHHEQAVGSRAASRRRNSSGNGSEDSEAAPVLGLSHSSMVTVAMELLKWHDQRIESMLESLDNMEEELRWTPERITTLSAAIKSIPIPDPSAIVASLRKRRQQAGRPHANARQSSVVVEPPQIKVDYMKLVHDWMLKPRTELMERYTTMQKDVRAHAVKVAFAAGHAIAGFRDNRTKMDSLRHMAETSEDQLRGSVLSLMHGTQKRTEEDYGFSSVRAELEGQGEELRTTVIPALKKLSERLAALTSEVSKMDNEVDMLLSSIVQGRQWVQSQPKDSLPVTSDGPQKDIRDTLKRLK